jgi:hypothetical protein
MFRPIWFVVLLCAASATASAQRTVESSKETRVPTAPPATDHEKVFHDARYQVTFKVPPGWGLTSKDGEVGTFHIDARSAPRKAIMRAVATLKFNPYPNSTLSGAMFYYSVEPHTTDQECAKQASAPQANGKQEIRQPQDIAGMSFTHGHDEYGDICVESRDEVYTAYRKGACYRFDLTVNTFCSVSSGVRDMTSNEMLDVEQKLADILSTVQLGWEKTPPHPVPVPEMQAPVPSPTPLAQPKGKIGSN